MIEEELKSIFQKYLNRDFTKNEWNIHGKKSYESFENEIQICKEYLEFNEKNIKSKKIAILLSGHIRKNSILNGLKKMLKSYDFDVFIHTWDNLGNKGSETNIDDLVDPDLVIREISKIPNVKHFVIENNKKYILSLDENKGYFNFSSPEPFIKSQLYSINKSHNLMEEHSKNNNIKYDVVFKFRFDCNIEMFELPTHIIEDLSNYDIIFTPNNKDSKHSHLDYGTSCYVCDTMYYKHKLTNVHIFEHSNVICDLFAYGNQKSMKDYCDVYNHYDELNNTFSEQNHISLKKHNKNIKIEDGNYKLFGYKGHLDSLYYYYCSYPERLLQKFLKNYMLIESKTVKLSLVR
jgi:hypothetical protein